MARRFRLRQQEVKRALPYIFIKTYRCQSSCRIQRSWTTSSLQRFWIPFHAICAGSAYLLRGMTSGAGPAGNLCRIMGSSLQIHISASHVVRRPKTTCLDWRAQPTPCKLPTPPTTKMFVATRLTLSSAPLWQMLSNTATSSGSFADSAT